MYPDIAKEATETYDYLIRLYPNKRNLMKTEVYKRVVMIKPTTSNHTPNETAVFYPQPTTSNHTPNETDVFYPQPTTSNHTQNETVVFYPQPTTSNGLQATTGDKQKGNEIEPLLEIPLLKSPLHVKDIIPQTPVVNQQYVDEVIQQSTDLLTELQQDPDLKWFFTDEPANHITLSSLEGTGPMALDQEIEQIIQTEFNLMGSDLPDIICEEDELSRLARM